MEQSIICDEKFRKEKEYKYLMSSQKAKNNNKGKKYYV
jgi:hypothetical protein